MDWFRGALKKLYPKKKKKKKNLALARDVGSKASPRLNPLTPRGD